MIIALQFITALIATLLGILATRLFIHFDLTFIRFAVLAGYWSLAILAYLIPRSASRVLRTRLLTCILILSVLAYGIFLFVQQLRFQSSLAIIFAPLFSILVFCILAFLTGTRRSWTGAAAVLVPTLFVHFFSLWWSFGFRTGLVVNITAIELMPLLAATGALLATDRLIKTGDNPTLHLEPISGS